MSEPKQPFSTCLAQAAVDKTGRQMPETASAR
jgi:hypothetical protein